MEPARASPKLDVNLVRRLLGSQFSHWAGLPIRSILPGGWANRTFRLGEDMVVRLPSAAAYALQIEKEHQWLPILRAHLPLPIPTPIALGQPGHGYPWPWSIYGWLQGKAVRAEQLSESHELARALGLFLGALQRVDALGGPPPGPDNFRLGGSLRIYDAQTRQAISLLKAGIDAKAAVRIWDEALAAPHQGPPMWLHGDVSVGNLLVESGVLAGVIDFGCSATGDPACDLAIGWSSMERRTRHAFRSVLELDEGAWARGRGWALWKALVVSAGIAPAHRATEKQSHAALGKILSDA
ncbi:MAG TPA: aminoglycoside phosphotransferase family protein [Allosphingosinicella sp.]|nr:aminoglycoside phosphotransferase family protein [Allosphingosinicella sp.]